MSERTRSYGSRPERAPLPLRVVVQGGAGSEYRLSEGRCVVGAGEDVDLLVEDDTVSRRHVELTLVPEGVEIVDLRSHNGTFYLGQRVQHIVLSPGSSVRLGRAELRFEADENAPHPSDARGEERYGNLVGASTVMQKLRARLKQLEGSLVSVLITGETGTGKEVVARTLHEHSLVSSGPFVAVNCGALDRTLVRSELFGHIRGAFTGAFRAQGGAFEAAHEGTLFLDEVGELPLEVQPVLLRALETGSVQRIGESSDRKVKVRLIAATNRRLEQLVGEREFREDLYYRLLVVRLELPPLRDRTGDIAELVQHFGTEFGLPVVPPDVMHQVEARPWPGNVRELRNAVRAYAALGAFPDSAPRFPVTLDAALRESVDISTPYVELKDWLLERFQRVYLDLLLARTKGNQSEAARLSGLDRTYLNKVLRRLR